MHKSTLRAKSLRLRISAIPSPARTNYKEFGRAAENGSEPETAAQKPENPGPPEERKKAGPPRETPGPPGNRKRKNRPAGRNRENKKARRRGKENGNGGKRTSEEKETTKTFSERHCPPRDSPLYQSLPDPHHTNSLLAAAEALEKQVEHFPPLTRGQSPTFTYTAPVEMAMYRSQSSLPALRGSPQCSENLARSRVPESGRCWKSPP